MFKGNSPAFFTKYSIKLIGKGNRAMLSSRAAKGDGQAVFALL